MTKYVYAIDVNNMQEYSEYYHAYYNVVYTTKQAAIDELIAQGFSQLKTSVKASFGGGIDQRKDT